MVHGFAQRAYSELGGNYSSQEYLFTPHVTARDTISLKSGFEYSSSGKPTFTAKLDEEMIMEESYLDDPIDPDKRELNTNYAVGSISGSHNVTPTGAATYNIPIAVPPATAGMQPQLSVGYNCQGGNGVMGIGWNLAGVSMITPTVTTIYHDGYIDGVNFDANDQYVWNG